MKNQFLLGFFLLLSTLGFGQYQFTGLEVYDSVPNNYFGYSYFNLDTNRVMEVQKDIISGNTVFTMFDGHFNQLYQNSLLMNSYQLYDASVDINKNLTLVYVNSGSDSIYTIKLDTTTNILWTNFNDLSPYVSYNPLANYYSINHCYHSFSKMNDFSLVFHDSLWNLRLLSFDEYGQTLSNGNILVSQAISPFFSNHHSNYTMDSQSNLYFLSTINVDLDTSYFSTNSTYRNVNLYKYNKYGSLVSTLPIYLNATSTEITFDFFNSIFCENDTLLLAGDRISSSYNSLVSPFVCTTHYEFYDTSLNIINSYTTPDTFYTTTSDAIGHYNFWGSNYLGKNINGNPLFLDNRQDINGQYLAYNPRIIEINISTGQGLTLIDLITLADSNLTYNSIMDDISILYLKEDPSGNITFFYDPTEYWDSINNAFFNINNRLKVQMSANGTVLSKDTVQSDFVPYIKNYGYSCSPNNWLITPDKNEIYCYRNHHTVNNNIVHVNHAKATWCFNCSPTVSGRVFMDTLNDCLDNAEPAFQNVLLDIDSGAIYSFTQPNGNYELFVDSGMHTINPVINPWYFSFWYDQCAILPLSINAPASPNISTGNDVPLALLPNVHEIQVLANGSKAKPGFDCAYWINLKNRGTVSESGVLEFSYTDSIFDFVSSIPAPDSISAGYLGWNYSNLPIFGNQYVNVTFTVPSTVSIGSLYQMTLSAGDISVDTFPQNNVYTRLDTVRGAWDPNDKQVTPAGIGPEGYITPQDSQLTYTVRFQNTGTDTAFTVRIEDMIDTDLDLSTLQIELASHPYSVQLNGQKLIFTFDNILLPDSGVNYAASNGAVQYSIRQKPSLPLGTQIKNTAAIYFDFNSPVITNTVVNTIDWATAFAEDISQNQPSVYQAYPNPFSGTLMLNWNRNNNDKLLSAGLYSIHGQKITDLTATLKEEKGTADLSAQAGLLNQGIYFLRIESKQRIQIIKIIKL